MTKIEESTSGYLEGLFGGNEEGGSWLGLTSFIGGVTEVVEGMLDRNKISRREADSILDLLVFYREARTEDGQSIGEGKAVEPPSFSDLNKFLLERTERVQGIIDKVAGAAAAEVDAKAAAVEVAEAAVAKG